jgi:TetR/AcrR family transcriptional regulator
MTQNTSGKEKLLESALAEFAEYGFEGARVDRIAKEAGVNKALIYYHFAGKTELYSATLNHLFEQAAPKRVEIPADFTVRQKMLFMMRQFLLFLEQNPRFVKIMDQAVHMQKEIFEKVYEQNVFFEMGLALYREGVEGGEIREVEEPADYLVSILGACYFFYSHRNAIRKFYDPQLSQTDLLEMRFRTLEDILERVLFSK